jgi:hypothetical protein
LGKSDKSGPVPAWLINAVTVQLKSAQIAVSGWPTYKELVFTCYLFKLCNLSGIQPSRCISSIRSIWVNYPKGRNAQSVKEADSRLEAFIFNNAPSNKAKSPADNTLRKHFSITNNSLRHVFRSYSAASITAHNLPAEPTPCAMVSRGC